MFMLAVFLLTPFLLIRFPLLSHFSKNALSRAAYFALMEGNEKIAYVVYQISNLGLFLFSCLIGIKFDFSVLFYMGVAIYLLGLTLCAISMRDFARPHANGMNTKEGALSLFPQSHVCSLLCLFFENSFFD